MNKLFTATALTMCLITQPAWADAETELLRQQVKELTERLDALEKKQAAQQIAQQAAPAAALPALAPAAGATLNQRVSALEQQQTADEKKSANVQYESGKGLVVTSPDKDFSLRMSAYFQADNHTFLDSSNPSNNTDQFYIRSARPIIEAKLFNDFSARLMWDFGNNNTQLLDAYADYKPFDELNLRVGKFKDPVGLERWQAEQNVLFVERGMTTNLVPYRDNGVSLYGNLIPGTLEYQLALTNGSPDLVNGTNNTDDDQSVTARLFAHPFYAAGVDALKGFGIGVAGSYGNRNASLANPNLTSGYVTPAQSKFFTYAATAFASGEQWRFNPQAMYYNGPFSLLGEYVLEDQGLRSGATTRDLQNNAWMLTTTYVVSGEDASFNGVVPRHNFDPAHSQWGAFELVGRVSQLHVDSAAFPVFASLATSAKEAAETTLGGTWYLNPNIKLNLDFALTSFDGGAANGGDRPTEKAILGRTQVNF